MEEGTEVATVNKRRVFLCLAVGTRPEPLSSKRCGGFFFFFFFFLVAEDGPTHANVKIYEELGLRHSRGQIHRTTSCITLPSWSS